MIGSDKMRITIYLLKEEHGGNVLTLENAISEEKAHEKGFEPVKLKGLPFDSKAYFNQGSESAPQWVSFLESYVEGDIFNEVYNSMVSFLVLLKVTQPDERIFALNFGRAYHLLETEKIEKRFGLRAAVNSVQSTKIKGMEVRKLAALARQKSVWINQITNLQLFAEDVEFGDDLVRRIAVRIPMKSSTDSGDAVHSSERSDDGMIIVYQVVDMAKAASTLRRDSPLRVSRYAL
jgi:uncharacterized protein (TIGR04141 family)